MTEIGEAEILTAARAGSVLDGDAAGARRTLQTAVLRRCCYELAAQVDPRGLRLRNVAIAGRLDLAGLTVPFPLRFKGCEFEFPVAVEGADLFELALISCPALPGLLGNGLRLRRDLDLSGSTVAGAHWTSASTSKQSAIWLCESEIGGRLLCIESAFDGQGGRCLQADRMQVAGVVRFIHGFTARGEIRMIGARINGSLDLDGAHLQASDGPAIDLADSFIGGSLFLTEDPDGRKPVIDGRFDAGSARIDGRFLIRNATIRTTTDVRKGNVYARPTAAGTAIDAPRLSVGAEVTFAEGCEVIGRIDMSMSDVSSLSIGADCAFRAPGRTALDLTNAAVRALLRLDQKATIEGTLRMAGAVIHGTLALHGTLSGPAENLSVVGGSAMTVDGDVYLTGLRTRGGRVNFQGATLGSVQAAGARLHNPDGSALRLSQAVIKGSVRLDEEFTAVGLVTVSRSMIEGGLQLSDGIFTCPGPAPGNPRGHALEVRSAVVRGGIDLGWRHVAPSVDFSDTTTTHLADDPNNWPDHYAISGLSYERFENPQGASPRRIWDQAARCAWLGRQTDFDSGPYEQAARVFRQHGYTDEAERILIAERRHAYGVNHAGAAWPTRVFDALYAAVGYGYRPSRVLWLLAVLLVLVVGSLELPAAQATLRANNGNGVVYTTSGALAPSGTAAVAGGGGRSGPVDACGDGQVRCFSPVLYAVDTVIPLISLDQRSTWYPDPHARWGEITLWWLNLATMLGWLLSSIFVLSLTRLARTS
jgi:hypothetical protein